MILSTWCTLGLLLKLVNSETNVLEETPILAYSVFPINIKVAILYNAKHLCTDNLHSPLTPPFSLSFGKGLNPRIFALNNPSDTLHEQFFFF